MRIEVQLEVCVIMNVFIIFLVSTSDSNSIKGNMNRTILSGKTWHCVCRGALKFWQEQVKYNEMKDKLLLLHKKGVNFKYRGSTHFTAEIQEDIYLFQMCNLGLQFFFKPGVYSLEKIKQSNLRMSEATRITEDESQCI